MCGEATGRWWEEEQARRRREAEREKAQAKRDAAHKAAGEAQLAQLDQAVAGHHQKVPA